MAARALGGLIRAAPRASYGAMRSAYQDPKKLATAVDVIQRAIGSMSLAGSAAVKRASGTKKRPKTQSVSTTKSGTVTRGGAASANAPTKTYKYKTVGIYKGKVSAPPEPVKFDKQYNRHGSVKLIENGFNVTAGSLHSMYVGHGVASTEILRSTFRAMVKNIFHQAKIEILNWSDLVFLSNGVGSTGYRFDMAFVTDPALNPNLISNIGYTPAGTLTYEQIADGLFDEFRNGSGAGDQPREPISLTLFAIARNEADTGNVFLRLGHINFKNCKFDYKVDSKLTFINKTLAEVTIGGESTNERDSALDIESNPLKGKVYSRLKKWANYVDVNNKARPGNSNNNYGKKLVCDDTTGLIRFTSEDSSTRMLQEVPPAWALGFNSERSLVINPAEIYDNKMSFSAQLSTSTVFQKFQYILGNSSLNTSGSQRVDFGHVSMVGLGKLVDTQRGAGADIVLGCQIQQKYCCALVYKSRTPSMPITQVNATQVGYLTDKPV